ncbi:hypothetical protein AGABI2DRAFT_78098 [Agaricus bisporus var. bisporus H97]|uniref:hypothetical protein n=1 Tax=Agaricus bisporus var. bisporus (strain H97 / ATCC MYA-4626 / FGSC 10389) TaxID=936046 RepID=UPI00029F74E4|nr:hypothetical protein AGABI2DRAFT_78098 [Agaricus bisporus var. bisporus H97]EKV42758.1 hypothetical protein AGABI2DRAFT_78098 [Agaricus bisporus var. bisporus H97]
MAPFSKPETVLRQAEGLVSVGQSHAALQSLTEMFASKRFRSTPLATLEPIMNRFIELCVEMRRGRTAKEGLMQYKNIAQNSSVQSIEVIISRFIQLADTKVREAQQQAAVAVDVDDLEASETPESILLGAVSGDQSKDRTDRALVTPWLKFLWESYRTSLETLKNNARLEAIYQQVAQHAFKFCLKYNRKVEFRRLCETLRLHLSNVAKYSHQQHSINLSDPDTLQHHLDTRFAQLNTSVELELWQEAFRSVEDVHNLLTLAKKAPRPAMMANYYEKLTKIFLMSGNALYHAAAWGRYYAIVTNIGGKSEEEMGRLAGQVLVSTLAVPVGLHTEEQDELKGKNARLTALLGLTRMPSRSGLLKDALSRDVLKLSPPSMKSLYQILEVTFDPLSLCTSIAPLLETLSADAAYAPYLPLLRRALLSRLLNQLSQVYSTVKVDTIFELVQPLNVKTEDGQKSIFNPEEIEAYIMGCARRGELDIRVDHKIGSITFVDDAFRIADDAPIASSSKTRESTIQPSLAENVRTRLGKIATSLHNTIQVLDGESVPPPQENQDARFKELVSAVEAERKALQIKRALVARRRELLSELTVRKEKEESSRRAEISRREKEEESKRQRNEARRRELERTKKEIESIRIDEAKKYAQSLVDKGILKANDVDKLDNYDTEGLIGMQVAQLEKEKKGMNERLRIVAKRIDHIERANRKEERPLLAEDYEEQQQLDRTTFEAVQKQRKEASKQAHKEDVETKGRLKRMMGDYDSWKQILLEKKGDAYKKKKEAANKKIEQEKAKRKAAVTKAWEEEKALREKEEAEIRAKEEEERKQEEAARAEEERLRREEEERIAEEEAARKKKEDEANARRALREKERQEALEKARLQQQREDEAEERRRQRRAEEKEKEAADKKYGSVRGPPVIRAANGQEPAWRRSASGAGAARPRAEPSSVTEAPPAPAAAAPAKLRPSWRDREAAKAAATSNTGGTGSPRPASPALPPAGEEPKKDDDGFQTVGKSVGGGGGAWKSRRAQASGGR